MCVHAWRDPEHCDHLPRLTSLVHRCHEQVEGNVRELVSKILETEKEVGTETMYSPDN